MEELSKLAFREEMGARINAEEARELGFEKLAAFYEGMCFTYHKMQKLMQGYMLNKEEN